MADLAASDVTVTLAASEQEFLGVGKKVTFPTISFGDGILTYPTGGVPLPAIGNFGMKKVLSRLVAETSANGVAWKYDPAAHTLRGWSGASEVSGALAAVSLDAIAFGS